MQLWHGRGLQAALLLRAPLIFAGAWALIKPVIDPVTAAKVFFVSAKAEAETCVQHGVPAELLPREYGGLSNGPWPYPNLPGEPILGGQDVAEVS